MNRYMSGSHSIARAQRGAVLFVALIFLVLMTLLAVVASNTSILQERMTGGMRNVQIAQLGADSAVRSTEFSIWNAASRSANLVCNGNGGSNAAFRCYSRFVDPNFPASGAPVALDNRVRTFRSAKGKLDPATDGASDSAIDFSAGTIPESARLKARARVMVELEGKVTSGKLVHSGLKPVAAGSGGGVQDFYSYRITARSTGGNDSAVRLAESSYLAQSQSISTP